MWVPGALALSGFFFQVYVAIAHLSGGISLFAVAFFLTTTLPYAGCVLIARVGRSPFVAACGAAAVLSVQGLLLYDFVTASGAPTASTLGFVFGSMGCGVAALPAGCLAGIVLLKLWPTSPGSEIRA